MHARRRSATLERALCEALLALEEELHRLAATDPADGACVPSHQRPVPVAERSQANKTNGDAGSGFARPAPLRSGGEETKFPSRFIATPSAASARGSRCAGSA